MPSLRVLLFLLSAFGYSTVWGADSVDIAFGSGSPAPGQSSEHIHIGISSVVAGSRDQDVDRYFTDVRRIVAEAQLPPEWGVPWIDGPSFRIEVVLGDKRFRMAAAFDATGVVLPLDLTEQDRRNAAALKQILALTLARLQTRLVPK